MMSGKKPLVERPLSSEATIAALNRIIGGEDTTDPVKYSTYVDEVARRQPAYWSQIRMIGEFSERAARVTKYPAELQRQAVVGGGLIYLASAEQQAAMQGRYVKPIRPQEARTAFLSAMVADEQTLQDMENAAVIVSREFTSDDVALLLDTGASETFSAADRIIKDRLGSLDSSPFRNENEEAIKGMAVQSLRGLVLNVVSFASKEGDFCSVMSDRWWSKVDPDVSLGQLIGASITRTMIWPPRKTS